MKKLLLLALISTSAFADTVSLSWTTPTLREDGTALLASEIANYRISWTIKNVAQTDILAAGTATSYTLNTGTLAGRVCAVLRTVDTDGLESMPTNAACRNARPNPPGNPKLQ